MGLQYLSPSAFVQQQAAGNVARDLTMLATGLEYWLGNLGSHVVRAKADGESPFGRDMRGNGRKPDTCWQRPANIASSVVKCVVW